MSSEPNRVTVTLPNDAVGLVEIDCDDAVGDAMVSARALTMDGVREAIAGFCAAALSGVKAAAPSSCDVEMSFKIGLEAGQLTALLVSGSSEATLKIALHWDGAPS